MTRRFTRPLADRHRFVGLVLGPVAALWFGACAGMSSSNERDSGESGARGGSGEGGATGDAGEGGAGGDGAPVCAGSEPRCGAICCPDNRWHCDDFAGAATCEVEPGCIGAPPICFEGSACCPDGTWECRDGPLCVGRM